MKKEYIYGTNLLPECPICPIFLADTGRGILADANSAKMLVPTEDPDFAPLLERVREFTEFATAREEIVKKEKLADDLLASSSGRALLASFGLAHDVMTKNVRAGLAADASAFEPAASTDRSNDATYQGIYRTSDAGTQAARLARAALPELTAVALEPDLAGLEPELVEIARERYLVENFVEKVGLGGSYPLRPSLERIIAVGTDAVQARNAAEAVLGQHKARLERAGDYETFAGQAVSYAAAAFDLTPQEALDAILAA